MNLIRAYSEKDGSINYLFDENDKVTKPNKPIKIRNCPQILLNYIEKLYLSNENHELKTILCKAVAEDQRLIVQEFITICNQLQKDGFNDNEIVEIISYLYSRNYEFFNGSNCEEFLKIKILNPTVIKYNLFYNYALQAQKIINLEGRIVPQNMKFDENTRKILTFDGFLEIPESILKLIISVSNKAFYQEEKKAAQKIELEDLFKKAREAEEQITIKEIETMESLMIALNYDDDVISKKINYLKEIYHTRRDNKNIETNTQNKILKEKAFQKLNMYFKYVSNELVLNTNELITEEEVIAIKESLQIIGCSKKRIDELLNEITRHNKDLKDFEKNEKISTLENHMFNIINSNETINYSADVRILYETAISMINTPAVDNNIQGYISKLSNLISFINEFILNMIEEDIISFTTRDFTEEDITDLQLVFLEIDECFENMCFVNPMIRIRLDNNQN